MSVVRASKLENVTCEEQVKLVQDRILKTEEHLAKLCSALCFYVKKTARLRDASDEVAVIINSFAVNENINKSLKLHLLEFSNLLATMGDIRDFEVQQLETKLIRRLTQYDLCCKNAKMEVKKIISLKERELNRRHNLFKAQNNRARNKEAVTKAELSQSYSNHSHVQRELEACIELLEKKKLQDVKAGLMEFVTIELAQHARCIETLSKAYNELDQINITKDLKDFRDLLNKKRKTELESSKRMEPRQETSDSSSVSYGKVFHSSRNGILHGGTDLFNSTVQETNEYWCDGSSIEESSSENKSIYVNSRHSF